MADERPQAHTKTELENFAWALEDSGRYRVLRAYEQPERYAEPNELRKRIAGILDTETTGTDHTKDKVIELGLVLFEYDDYGEIHDIVNTQTWFEDPGIPIPEEATAVNGITDKMVKGKKFPEPEIATLIDQCVLLIAHNAAFDRGFCERRFDWAKNKGWACSLREIDWRELEAPAQSLQSLAWHFGFFFDGHRAVEDSLALLHLLAMKPRPVEEGEEPRTLFAELLDSARATTSRIWAWDSPFDKKDILRARGYRWHDGSFGPSKCWYRDLPPDQVDEEQLWLSREILMGRSGQVEQLTARERYSLSTIAGNTN